MGETIIVHDNMINVAFHFAELNLRTKQYEMTSQYIPIEFYVVDVVFEDKWQFFIKFKEPFMNEDGCHVEKDQMTEEELIDFYRWCKLNKVKKKIVKDALQ